MAEVRRTDAVQGDILHEYDGIEEADNELPNWWLAIFYGTTMFAIGYWFVYQEYELLPSQNDILVEQQAALAAGGRDVDLSDLADLSDKGDLVAAGAATYQTNCVACHADKGQGNIGPNLTDKFWIHGGRAEDIYANVTTGVPEKGMPAWGAILGAGKVREVTAFVLSLRNTNVAGKEPQGDPFEGE